MSLKNIRALFTAAAVSLLMISCGGEESAPDPKAPAGQGTQQESPIKRPVNKIVEKMDPDGKAMHLTATNPAGKKFEASIGDRVEIPEGFPEDVPIFTGSIPMASMSAPDGFIVTFKSDEDQQLILDFYRSKLTDAGWEIAENPMDGSPLSIDAAKDSRKVSVVVAGRKGDARVSVIVTLTN